MALNTIIDPSTDTKFIDSIRRLLGGVDEETLADEDILDPAFFDMAEIEILDLVPCLLDPDISPTDLAKARLAMIYLIASKLCATVKGRVEYEVKTIDVTWRRSPVKYDDLKDDLLETVENMLNGIECYVGTGDTNIFAIAPSNRAVNDRG